MRLAGPAILSEKYGANNHPEPIVVVMTAIAMLISVRFRFNEDEGASAAIPGPVHEWFRKQLVIAPATCVQGGRNSRPSEPRRLQKKIDSRKT